MTDAQVVLRGAEKTDVDFIMATWLRGQYWGSNYWKQMDQDLFFKNYAEHIKGLLYSSGARIDMAVLQSDPSMILGFIVYDTALIHWCYCKKDYRKKGILKLLLKDKRFQSFTGDTKAGQAIGKQKNLMFNPIKGR